MDSIEIDEKNLDQYITAIRDASLLSGNELIP
jgi:hypothetical protein